MITRLSAVEKSILDRNVVLDVGGWACPFNRTNYVLDAMPFETRGFYRTIGFPASQGQAAEYFDESTWVQRDICGPEKWPFPDKHFDFAVCSHTLEDVRDPLFVCAELNRVAKRGYIEVPSRLVESCLGAERNDMVGLSHHRWLVEIQGHHLRFLQKYHVIHTDFDLHFPRSFLRVLPEHNKIETLFWDGAFSYEEVWLHGTGHIYEELRDYVSKKYRYPRFRYWGKFLAAFSGRAFRLAQRIWKG